MYKSINEIWTKFFIIQERLENMRYLKQLEDHRVECLSSDVRLLNELPTTKRLAEFIKQYDETQERWVYMINMAVIENVWVMYGDLVLK